MGTVCQIGLDIAKEIFQVHGVDEHGKDVLVKKLKGKDVLSFFAKLPPCRIGIEACGGAHYWAREITKLDVGHSVHLISPRLVKPFVINNKTMPPMPGRFAKWLGGLPQNSFQLKQWSNRIWLHGTR